MGIALYNLMWFWHVRVYTTQREREQWIINTHVLFVCLLSNKPQKETAGQGTCSLVKRAYALQGCIARYTAVGLNQLIKALIFGIINKSSLMSYWYAWCHKMLELRYWVHDLLVTHPYSWPLTSYPVSAVDHEALLCVRLYSIPHQLIQTDQIIAQQVELVPVE